MKNFKTEIIINAPVEFVWQTLMDFKNYGIWNPFVRSIAGKQKEGEVITISLQPSGGKPMAIRPTILKINTNKEFRWLGHLFVKGLFDGEHYFILESIDAKTTRFIHGENFSGVLVSVLLKMIGKSTLSGFEAMNEQLKVRVENLIG